MSIKKNDISFFNFKEPQHEITPLVFCLWRFTLGGWIFYNFFSLSPHIHEIVLKDGLQGESLPSFVSSFAPGLQNFTEIKVYLIACYLSSLLFALGLIRKVAGLILLILWSYLHFRAYHTPLPSDGFLSWLIFLTLLVPAGENKAVLGLKTNWYYPKVLYQLSWNIFLINIFFSGVDKLKSPLWLKGEALLHIFQYIAARESFIVELLMAQPKWTLEALNYFVIFMETFISALALIWVRYRLLFWILFSASLLLFASTLMVFEIAIGTLIGMLFLFNPKWLEFLQRKNLIKTKLHHLESSLK